MRQYVIRVISGRWNSLPQSAPPTAPSQREPWVPTSRQGRKYPSICSLRIALQHTAAPKPHSDEGGGKAEGFDGGRDMPAICYPHKSRGAGRGSHGVYNALRYSAVLFSKLNPGSFRCPDLVCYAFIFNIPVRYL